MIELVDIVKKFDDLKAVDRVSLKIEKGEKIVIIGPSGSGKTTLLRTINFLEKIDSGRILMGGREVGYRADGKGRLVLEKQDVICSLRSEIGMVFQHFHLFPHMTILQNVMEGPVTVKRLPREEARKTALDLLGKVGLLDKKDTYPAFLSGGQKQRVAIARTLINDTPVLVFDDSLSAVDTETDAAIRQALKNRSRDVTTFIISHRINTLKEADLILVMEQGRVTQQGIHEELIAQQGLYRDIWELQTEAAEA